MGPRERETERDQRAEPRDESAPCGTTNACLRCKQGGGCHERGLRHMMYSSRRDCIPLESGSWSQSLRHGMENIGQASLVHSSSHTLPRRMIACKANGTSRNTSKPASHQSLIWCAARCSVLWVRYNVRYKVSTCSQKCNDRML